MNSSPQPFPSYLQNPLLSAHPHFFSLNHTYSPPPQQTHVQLISSNYHSPPWRRSLPLHQTNPKIPLSLSLQTALKSSFLVGIQRHPSFRISSYCLTFHPQHYSPALLSRWPLLKFSSCLCQLDILNPPFPGFISPAYIYINSDLQMLAFRLSLSLDASNMPSAFHISLS